MLIARQLYGKRLCPKGFYPTPSTLFWMLRLISAIGFGPKGKYVQDIDVKNIDLQIKNVKHVFHLYEKHYKNMHKTLNCIA